MVRMSSTSSSTEDLTFWRFFKQTSVTRVDIFFLGITGILSSVVNTWTYAAHYGIWILLTSMIFPTIGYVLLTLCGAEMTSALPFSGGIYGAVRAFTTPLLGFVVAMFELVLNVSFVSSVVYSLGSLPVDYGSLPEWMILVNCLITYLVILAILLVGGKIFWLLNTCLGLIVLTLLVIYLLGSSSFANFDEWGQGKYYHTFEAHEFMQQIPMVSTCFLGIQLIPLTSRCAPNPKKDIPIVMCILIVVCIVVTLSIMITAASQYPGIDGYNSAGFPLTYGFSRIFNISDNAAVWLNVPFLFATAFTFIFFCGRQASCMSKSGLIPEIFQQNLPILDTPYVSLLTFIFINFVLNTITFFNKDLIVALNVISSLSSFIVYILAFVAYIQFHKKYSSLERFFASPFGDVGAYVGIVIFVFCFIGAAIFQETITPIVTVIVIAVLAVVYYLFLSGEHVFSEEEREELFKAYLINANIATKKRIQKRGQVTPSPQGKVSNHSYSSITTAAPTDSIYREPKSSPLALHAIKSDSSKLDHISPPTYVTPSSVKSERVDMSMSHKSLSEKAMHYLSSKLNQILPDPVEASNFQQLEILKAGGMFSDSTNEV